MVLKNALTLSLDAIPAGGQPVRVLVVDDSRAQRKLTAVYLRRCGYEVVEADTAEAALALCTSQRVDIVISDWMMPGMTGVDFCRAFRAMPRETWGYFILVTSKSEKYEIARGLEAGADDFLPKPVNADELRARVRAGLRLHAMQSELVEKNRVVEQTLAELQRLYDTLDRDLIEARKLQQTLLRDRHRDFGRAKVDMVIRASGHVGGDLVGSLRLDERRVAAWSVDVSGHGVAAAMMTARLAGYLAADSRDQNLAFKALPDGKYKIRAPSELMAEFNRLMIEDLQVEQYFTMIWAELDLKTGRLRLVQAGHPHPVILRATGEVVRLGNGGLPVGLIAEAGYEDLVLRLQPGDRLFLMSDGITECPDANGQELGEAGSEQILARLAGLPSGQLLDALIAELALFAGTDRFPDDVSGLILSWQGAIGATQAEASANRVS